MDSKSEKRLTLRKETISNLTPDEMARGQGGAISTALPITIITMMSCPCLPPTYICTIPKSISACPRPQPITVPNPLPLPISIPLPKTLLGSAGAGSGS